MESKPHHGLGIRILLLLLSTMVIGQDDALMASEKPRVIVTSDGEIDDECSMVRFLLYANEFDIEGIITSSSQYHWQGHKWAGDDWAQPYLVAYAAVQRSGFSDGDCHDQWKRFGERGQLRSARRTGQTSSHHP
jgi:hypothetical protein